MNLLIDAGNTRIKYAIYQHGKITVTDTDFVFKNLNLFTGAVVSCVRQSNDLSDLYQALQKAGIPVVDVKVEPERLGVRCGYKNYSNLGVDRWLGILAAAHMAKSLVEDATLIVDAGTAMTVDVLNARNEHLGGWILPGYKLMQESIITKAPNVFDGPCGLNGFEFGKDTPDALRNGCLAALLGAIEIAKQLLIKGDHKSGINIIVTGGDSELIAKHLTNDHVHVNPELIFEGLQLYLNDLASKNV